jgi:hypothetical protein
MLRRTLFLALAAVLITLATSGTAQAWGGFHYAYHYSPYTGLHYAYHYSYGGMPYGGYHYGGYPYAGYHYGGYPYGGYRYGYYRAW